MESVKCSWNISRDDGCLRVRLFAVQTELATSFTEQPVFLKEQLAGTLWLLRCGIWRRFPWKWMKRACHSRENQQYSLTMIKFKLWSKNQSFGKLTSVTVSLTASQYLKDFSDEINGDINEYDSLLLRVKWLNIWKICITQWTNTSQMANSWCWKIMHKLKNQHK